MKPNKEMLRKKHGERKGSFSMLVDDVPTMAELDKIIARLQQLSHEQELIKRTYTGYAEWYKVAPEDLVVPSKMQINFRLQTLYFQPGVTVRLPAYITTTVELDDSEKDFGIYSLFTNLDGSYRDNTMIWASTTIYKPWKDYRISNSIEPVKLINVPTKMHDVFPKLHALVRNQQLVDRASQRCAEWFRSHPHWYLDYPVSLAEDGIKKDVRRFRKYPLWYKRYPKNLLLASDIRIVFEKQVLCFNHVKYAYAHIKTYITIYASGYEIGTYCFVTTLDGTADENLSMIIPFPLKTEL